MMLIFFAKEEVWFPEKYLDTRGNESATYNAQSARSVFGG